MGRRKWVWKDEPPRFKPRRLASGKVLYYYQAGGKQIPLGSNRITALEEWARLEAGGIQSALWPTVTALFRKSVFPNVSISTRDHYKTAFKNLDSFFRSFTLEQVEPQDVKAYMRQRSKKGAALFEKRVGSAFFNWAREEGHTKAANPFHGVKFSKSEKKGYPTGRRKKYVTDAEYRTVWQAGDDILRDAMDLAYYTGQRPSDVLKARRQDIQDGAIWFAQEKTDARLGVRIVGELARVLERILARPRAISSVYLIADKRGQRVLYNGLNERFVKARGDADWQFRDIRAKTATDFPELKKAQLLLGHATETTTTIYRRSRGELVEPPDRKIQDVS